MMSAKLKAVFLKEAENMEKEERWEWAKTVRCLVEEVEQLQSAAQHGAHLTAAGASDDGLSSEAAAGNA